MQKSLQATSLRKAHIGCPHRHTILCYARARGHPSVHVCSLPEEGDLFQDSVELVSCPVHVFEAFVSSASNMSVTMCVWKPSDNLAKNFSQARQYRTWPHAVVAEAGTPAGATVPVVGMITPAQASWSRRVC